MRQSRLWFVAVLGTVVGANALADRSDIPDMQLAPNGGDTYVVGEHVVISAPINGDLVAAGETVRVAGDVAEDVIAAAASIEIVAEVADDVRLAGAEVELQGAVSGHAVIAGADVRLAQGASIGDWLWVSGSRVRLDGEIGGELRAAGADVELNATVAGDVDIVGAKLRLGDNAVVAGDLTWRSSEPIEISDKAVVRGQITEASMPEAFAERDGWSLSGLLIYALSLLLTAGALRSLFPAEITGCDNRVREHPVQSFIVGLAVFATAPLVISLLLGTVVGWLLAVIAGLLYTLALASAGVVGMNALAAIGLVWLRRGNTVDVQTRDVWVALAFVALLVTFVWPVLFLLAVFGLGAMAMGFYQRWMHTRGA